MEIHELTAREVGAHLRSGELSARELVDALLERTEQVDRMTGALCHRFVQRARREADESDARRERGEAFGALDGVPITIKESLDTEGVASTLGLRSRMGRIADRDAVVVDLLRRA